MKKLYNEKKRLIKLVTEVGYLLDKEIDKRFGFNYSQTDSDPMIDTLDYGTQNLSYKNFIELMEDYKKKMKNEEWTPNH